MRIAYLMLVHTNPRLLRRAIGALSSEDCAFLIHVDRKANIEEFRGIDGVNVFFSEHRMPVYWGEFSQVEATMHLLRQVLGCSVTYDYFVLLHGSDYPLRSNTYIQKFLSENRGSEFISMVKMPAPGFPMSKINKLRYPSDKPVRRFASRAMARLGLAHRDHEKRLGGLRPYAGDACWALSRDACQYILDFASSNPQLEKYFRNTFTSDEMFFHTIIGNSPFCLRTRRSLLYTDWGSTNGNHPLMLNEVHVRFFEEKEKVLIEDQFGSSEVLFARKFSDSNLRVIDLVDAMIKRKEGRGQCPESAPVSLDHNRAGMAPSEIRKLDHASG